MYPSNRYSLRNPHLQEEFFWLAPESRSYTFIKIIQSLSKSELRDFFSYVLEMEYAFELVRQGMDYENPQASHHAGDDINSAGWAGHGMMPMAIYLYYMKSCGIVGDVLECGVFKGGSTCCLSHICDYLGLRLVAADSFAGLPSDEGYYGKGDFCGSIEEVQENMARLGKPEVVTWKKGWFSESLQGMDEQFMMIWLDVDLKQSVIDVLTNVYRCLSKNGVIFCDGLGADRDFAGDQLTGAGGESAGLVEYFNRENIPYKAVHTGFGYMGLVVPEIESEGDLLYSSELLHRILFASRPWNKKIHLLAEKIRSRIRRQR